MRGSNKKQKKIDRILNDVVRDYSLESTSVSSIIKAMSTSGGFQSRNLSYGVDILRTMRGEKRCTKFLSFVGALLSTGVRGIIRDMLKDNMFDCVITTCGALDHDVARTYRRYYAGDFRMDDSILLKKKIHRLGNVLVPEVSYGSLIEKKVQSCLEDLYNGQKVKQDFSAYEIISHIGSTLDESSFLYWAHKRKIPVIVPGIVDGAVGSQIWLFQQQHKDFKIDILKDESKLSDLVYDATKTGAFMIGGGISKHHTLWWNQFRGGLDYAVYITSAPEWDGSLSGALVSEAISWGKVAEKAKQTTIHGEATTLLPFIYAALKEDGASGK
ncbi:MAG: deoxyhypusine synthase [Nitrosopumilales archaeon]|nr:deoxyhypusine synthase [Nitrosopumilales archaeon]